jgi:hypothetical protein
MLSAEYAELKNDSILQPSFEKAIEILRDIDDKVRASSPIDIAKGILVLPWIDREAIDNKHRIESEALSIDPEPITWKTAMENADYKTKKAMENSYEKAIYCIRALAVINDRLFLENDLETMVQLHSRLASNTNVNCTPTGVYYQNFSTIKDTYGDGENFPELDPQTKFNLRRYDLIVNDFWGHQARRINGDLTVGEMILPWVEVKN